MIRSKAEIFKQCGQVCRVFQLGRFGYYLFGLIVGQDAVSAQAETVLDLLIGQAVAILIGAAGIIHRFGVYLTAYGHLYPAVPAQGILAAQLGILRGPCMVTFLAKASSRGSFSAILSCQAGPGLYPKASSAIAMGPLNCTST